MAGEVEFSPWMHKIGQSEHQQAILRPHVTTVLHVYLLQINNKSNIIKILKPQIFPKMKYMKIISVEAIDKNANHSK